MYLSWEQKTITDFSDESIESMYSQGYVFTRIGKGEMSKTRSLRIDLSKFELSSENRRILGKVRDLTFNIHDLPFAMYSWRIHKLGAHFYTTKFGNNVFSANKIKELMTDPEKSSFNRVIVCSYKETEIAYVICLETPNVLHYAYPFYDLDFAPKETGLGMMTRALQHAKETGKQYVYLGSARRPEDTYKLQFAGVEWFDGTNWSPNIQDLKSLLRGDQSA